MPILAKPSISTFGLESVSVQNRVLSGTPSGTINWVGANVGLFVPIVLRRPILAKRMIILNGSTVNGNIDAGIYTRDGAKIVSTGAVTHTGASAIQFIDITDTYLSPGMYYMAVSCSSGTTRVRRINLSVARQQSMGVLQASSAHVLPATVTFISPTTAQIPIIAIEIFGVI